MFSMITCHEEKDDLMVNTVLSFQRTRVSLPVRGNVNNLADKTLSSGPASRSCVSCLTSFYFKLWEYVILILQPH